MNYRITAIIQNPETSDVAVLTDRQGRNMVIKLVDGSSAIDLTTGHEISFDWEPFGPGVAKNITTDKEINIIVEANKPHPSRS